MSKQQKYKNPQPFVAQVLVAQVRGEHGTRSITGATPVHGLVHAGLIPEPGYLSDDEDLSQVCQSDDEVGSTIQAVDDWMTWNARQEVYIIKLRAYWLSCQQAARSELARELAYCKF